MNLPAAPASAGAAVRLGATTRTGELRVIHVAKFAEAPYGLHPFGKKSQKTTKADLDLAKRRYAQLFGLQLRARLMADLIRIVRSRKLTQEAAARLLGVSQRRVSDLMRAKVDKFSSDALVEMLVLAGIELEVTPHVTRRVA